MQKREELYKRLTSRNELKFISKIEKDRKEGKERKQIDRKKNYPISEAENIKEKLLNPMEDPPDFLL